ncbi:MAG: hypothetical protein J5I98_01905 [Phaeodactylibacter sp.]|nr:hypothetical protein [Phaeodactylibacter sp.]
MKTIYYFLSLCLAFLVNSCVQPPNYPNTPEIAYVGVDQNTIHQGNAGNLPDTLEITFSFTDGDGDLGTDGEAFDVFLTDSRDGFTDIKKLPIIPDQGIGNGISGEITIRLPNRPFGICCIYPDNPNSCEPNPDIPTNEISYQIQIQDRAGNMSNTIQTEVITILCD